MKFLCALFALLGCSTLAATCDNNLNFPHEYCMQNNQCLPCKGTPNVKGITTCVDKSHYALTFHNGPFPATAGLLNVLKAKDVKATFFITGQNLQFADRVALLQRADNEGHTIATDSYRHQSYLNMTQEQLNNDVTRANLAILNAIGKRPRYVRPPFGDVNDKVYNMLFSAPACYSRVTMWNMDVQDYKYATTDPSKISDIAHSFMESHPSQSVLHLQQDMLVDVVDQVGFIIDSAKSHGYKLVTLQECFGEPDVSPYLDLASCNTAWTPTDSAGSSVVPHVVVLISALLLSVFAL